MCKHFKPYEFVPKDMYNKYGNKVMRWVNPKIVNILDYLREKYGKRIIVNNWKWNGKLQYRCLRPFDCTVGSKMSDHKFGNAVDFNIDGLSADDVWDKIMNECVDDLKVLGLTCVEDKAMTPTWTHISVADFSEWNDVKEINGIKIVKDNMVKK